MLGWFSFLRFLHFIYMVKVDFFFFHICEQWINKIKFYKDDHLVCLSISLWVGHSERTNRCEKALTVLVPQVMWPCLFQKSLQRKLAQTCVLYPPRLCELCVRGHRLALADCHIFYKRHWRRVDVWTLKVIICSNGCLKIPVRKERIHS